MASIVPLRRLDMLRQLRSPEGVLEEEQLGPCQDNTPRFALFGRLSIVLRRVISLVSCCPSQTILGKIAHLDDAGAQLW